MLLAADVLQETGLALEAVDAFEYHGLVPQVRCESDWPALDACSHAVVPLNSADVMRLPNFLTTCGCLQMEPAQLNAIYTRLLEALYTTAASEARTGSPRAHRCTHPINLYQCTRVADAWQRQAGAWSAKVAPQTAEAYEELAVVRVLGQQDYSGERHRLGCPNRPPPALRVHRCQPILHRNTYGVDACCSPPLAHYCALAGWKALRSMSNPEMWGRPPNRSTLLLLLHGLAAQLQAGLPPDSLAGAMEAAQRLAADLMTEAVAVNGSNDPAAKWPTLDNDLAAQALKLVLACYNAAIAEEEEALMGGAFSAVDSAAALTAVEQAAQGVMRSYCAGQEALPPLLCSLILDASTVAAALEDWVAAAFGEEAVDEITLAGEGTPPVLLQLQPAGEGRHCRCTLRARLFGLVGAGRWLPHRATAGPGAQSGVQAAVRHNVQCRLVLCKLLFAAPALALPETELPSTEEEFALSPEQAAAARRRRERLQGQLTLCGCGERGGVQAGWEWKCISAPTWRTAVVAPAARSCMPFARATAARCCTTTLRSTVPYRHQIDKRARRSADSYAQVWLDPAAGALTWVCWLAGLD